MKTRYLWGALLSATAMGLAIYLGLIGPVDKPDPLVLNFSRGTTLAAGETERLAVFASKHIGEDQLLFHVTGHTGERGDVQANIELSGQRASLVATELKNLGITEERIVAVSGVGSADPLPANSEIPEASLQRQMARVVVTSLVHR